MTKQVADWLAEHRAPRGVGVVLCAEHLCMRMRTTVEVDRGAFGFFAARAGVHDGEFETLARHTFQVTPRLFGIPGGDGTPINFGEIKVTLREASDT